MSTRFVITGKPESEPVDLPEMKLHLREDGTEQDTLITSFIKAAREYAEGFQGRAFITQTIKLYLDAFGCYPIMLPRPPLVSVSSVKYIDATGALQTLASTEYQVIAEAEPAFIVPAYGKVWPVARYQPSAIVVEYVAGYGAATDVPETVRSAIKLIVGHLYENREATVLTGATVQEVPLAVESLLWMERVVNF